MTIFLLLFAFLNVSNFVSITIKYESKLWNHLKEVVSWEYVFDLSWLFPFLIVPVIHKSLQAIPKGHFLIYFPCIQIKA